MDLLTVRLQIYAFNAYLEFSSHIASIENTLETKRIHSMNLKMKCIFSCFEHNTG